MVEELQGRLIHIEVVARILVAFPSWEAPRRSLSPNLQLDLSHGTLPTLVVPAERYVEQLWAALDQTLLHSKCGIGSDTPVEEGGTLDLKTLTIVGGVAPPKPFIPAPGVPPPPEYLPEMKDELIVKNTIKALSPRIIAVHGPQGQESPPFNAKELQSGLTICAQPRRIFAQQLCERVKSNRKMHYHDRTVGYMIARESSRDSSTKLLYCIEAIVAMMLQAYLVSSDPPLPQDVITTVIIDEVHNRSAHSDYVLALTLAVMQKKSS